MKPPDCEILYPPRSDGMFTAISFRTLIIFLIIAVALFLTGATPMPSVVTLTYFDVRMVNGQVQLLWETATEIDNAGFYINRSTNQSGGYARIPVMLPGNTNPQQFIPSQMGGIGGAQYVATDPNVQTGVTYYYWLEAVSNAGISEFIGPEFVSETTSTPTATSSTVQQDPSTSTPTPSQTASPTRTQTRTTIPTNTSTTNPYPAPIATTRPPSTPTLFGTLAKTLTASPSGTPTPTTTLIPLPSLTLLFPSILYSITPEQPTQLAGSQEGLQGTKSASQTSLSPQGILLVGIILLIWLLLGAILYIYLHRLGH